MHCGGSGSEIKPYAGRRLKKQILESAEGLALFCNLPANMCILVFGGVYFLLTVIRHPEKK